MKDDEFDELIRQKLESETGLPAAPADVSRVMKYVKKKKGFPLKGGISRWLYFILPVATVFTFYVVLKNSHQFKTELSQNEQSVHEIDTILNHQTAQPEKELPPQPHVTASPEIEPAIATGKQIKTDNILPVKEKVKTTDEHDKTAINFEPAVIPSKSNPLVQNSTENITKHSGTENTEINLKNKEENAESTVDENQIEESENRSEEVQKVKSSNDDSHKIVLEPVTQIPDTGNENNENVKHRTQKKIKIRPFGNNGIFKKTDEGEFKVGPSFAVFQHSYGFGLDAYRSVLKNSGIHAGFHYSVFQREYFTNREDFDTHHHHGKPPDFDKHLHGNEKPVDIVVTNKVLQFNVGISHYFRLKNNFSIPLSLGTNMDVKLWQNLNYKIENDSIRNNRFSFQTPEKARAFNNIYLMTGLEKSWRSWSFQVQPFLGYQFSTPGYRRFTWEPGIGASVYYVFGR